VVVDTCNPSTQDVEAERLQIRGQSKLHSEFWASLGYNSKTLCQTIQNNKKTFLRTDEIDVLDSTPESHD
jgi:hypothetical protein